jgi:DNA invertase Pin-like site-specific DNA recombinase
MKKPRMTPPHNFGEMVYSYARFSTKQQALGDSERRQQENAQLWAREHGCQITYILDPGISARRGKNRTVGQFGAFIAKLRSGELGATPTLLVENFDRISREDITDALPQFLELIKLGATIVTLHNRMVYRHPIDLTEAMLALVEMKAASAYSANLSRRIGASWERARREAQKGACIHRSTTPGWLRLGEKGIEVIPERAALAKTIFQRYMEGEGTQKIANWLNQRGIPAWPHKGQKAVGWHANGVKLLLRNRALLGEFQMHRESPEGARIPVGAPILGYFPAVMEPAMFFAAQELHRSFARRGKPVRDYWNLVAGLAWSGVDGSPMWGQKHSPGRQREIRHYLKSRGSMIGMTKPTHFLEYGNFERRLLALIRHLDEGAIKNDNGRDETVEAQAEVARIARQVEKYRRLIRDDDDPSPTLIGELKRCEQELVSARSAESKAFDRQARVPAKPRAVSSDLQTPEDRCRLHARIAQDFEKFVFDRDVVHCWFQESTRQGVDMPLSGPIVFNQPTRFETANQVSA